MKPTNWPWPIWIGLLSLLLWCSYAMLALSTEAPDWLWDALRLPRDDTSSILARRGQFGDAFGAFNALISTFALIGLFFTIRSQQEQLTEQGKASRTSERLTHQQQFQEQFYRAIDAYRSLLVDFTLYRDGGEGSPVNGRAALWQIWRQQLISHLRIDPQSTFGRAVRCQLNAYEHEGLGKWNSNAELSSAVRDLRSHLDEHPDELGALMETLGKAWHPVYGMHRYQLDSLFRAWYTVYRVLETAPTYELEPDAIRLYSAIYRAQLSWIEMAFLLINQSGLPGNPTYPRACKHTNTYAVFDNLDAENDVVVIALGIAAMRRTSSDGREVASLDGRAFGSASLGAR